MGVSDTDGDGVVEGEGLIDDEAVMDGEGVDEADGDIEIVGDAVMELEGLIDNEAVMDAVGEAVGVVLGLGQHLVFASLQKKSGTSSSSPAQACSQLCSLTEVQSASWQHLSLSAGHPKRSICFAPEGQLGVEKHFWSALVVQSGGWQHL